MYVFLIQPRSPARHQKTIAVLPFTNAGSDTEDEYFVDGVTEDIYMQLSKVAGLKVISMKTMMQYKGTKKTYAEIGDELKAGVLLEGNIGRTGDRFRIAARLRTADDQAILWSTSYEGGLKDLFDLESSIPVNIAGVLGAELSAREKEQIEKKPTKSSNAYVSYIRGREYYYLYDKKDNENAIVMFKKALDQDSTFALAYAGLGDAYAQRFIDHGFGGEWIDSAITMCNRAISIDSTLAEGYKALGVVYYTKGWCRRALEQNARAVGLNPGNADAVNNFGVMLNNKGDFEEGIRWIKKGLVLDPNQARGYVICGEIYMDLMLDSIAEEYFMKAIQLEQNNLYAHADLVWLNLSQGKIQQAAEESEKTLAIDPNDPSAIEVAGFVEFYRNRYEEARKYFEKIPAIESHSEGTAILAYMLLKNGKSKEAAGLFAKARDFWLKEISDGNELGVIRYDLAALYAVFGNRDEAHKWLQEAVNVGWLDYRWAQLDRLMEDVSSDETFRQMMTEVRLEVERQQKNVAEYDRNGIE